MTVEQGGGVPERLAQRPAAVDVVVAEPARLDHAEAEEHGGEPGVLYAKNCPATYRPTTWVSAHTSLKTSRSKNPSFSSFLRKSRKLMLVAYSEGVGALSSFSGGGSHLGSFARRSAALELPLGPYEWRA